MGGTRRESTNDPSNLLIVCGSGTTGCHGWIEGNRADAKAAGLLVSQWDDPAAVPYVDLAGNRWMLTTHGTRSTTPG